MVQEYQQDYQRDDSDDHWTQTDHHVVNESGSKVDAGYGQGEVDPALARAAGYTQPAQQEDDSDSGEEVGKWSKHVDKHVKNPMAHLLNQGQFSPRRSSPKKGRGSYSRKGAKYYTKGGPLSGLLSLGDDATDLARKNLERIKNQPVARTSRLPASSDKWQAPKRNVWGADSVSPEAVKKVADVATDFIPGVGEAKDIARAGSNIAAGNYGAAALDAATAAIGVVLVLVTLLLLVYEVLVKQLHL